tara:strand:- start:4114 stop:4623 length:510 start_codon:yes stop_codon:yes gene_type:complete
MLIKSLKLTFQIIVSCLLISCEDNLVDNTGELTFDIRLPQDKNGYYELTIDRNNWQTLHRVSANVTDALYLDNFRISWESNLYWQLNDTLGYIIKERFSDWSGRYVATDTSYITGFDGFTVPTTNRVSYSNQEGEINNMIAPVRSMVGDTLLLGAFWAQGEAFFGIILK